MNRLKEKQELEKQRMELELQRKFLHEQQELLNATLADENRSQRSRPAASTPLLGSASDPLRLPEEKLDICKNQPAPSHENIIQLQHQPQQCKEMLAEMRISSTATRPIGTIPKHRPEVIDTALTRPPNNLNSCRPNPQYYQRPIPQPQYHPRPMPPPPYFNQPFQPQPFRQFNQQQKPQITPHNPFKNTPEPMEVDASIRTNNVNYGNRPQRSDQRGPPLKRQRMFNICTNKYEEPEPEDIINERTDYAPSEDEEYYPESSQTYESYIRTIEAQRGEEPEEEEAELNLLG
ncbi:drebrin-like protein [Wyeomyia smithii]|uniref:drebrin-like protein n=1 Tax=Wyeomyia smithii TaxID=174621 RepID=UPI0024680A61|nr:drebrin-like protein [Wyeomyia smithii]XP_055522758.1 drebrin-like protein [Wyeomyia smithii]